MTALPPAQSMRRILLVGVNWMGDLLFMTPAIRAIKKAYPDSFIACLVPPRGVALMEGNPHLDEVIPFEESRGLSTLFQVSPMVQTLKEKRFDAAFLFHRSATRAWLTQQADIPVRIGYITPKRKRLLTHPVPMPNKDEIHKVDWFLKLLEGVGIALDGYQYDAGLLEEDRIVASELLSDLGGQPKDRWVVLHVGANWDLKRWPVQHFARLSDRLVQELGAKVLFIGTEEDRSLVESVQSRTRQPSASLVGKTSFRQMGAVLELSDLIVSNDSGPLHMGLAVKTPVVALFGATDPKLTAPPEGEHAETLFGSVGCPLPCYQFDCPKNLCMHQISVDQVMDSAKRLLQ